ncbi:MAG: DUF898 family protein [Bacteroidales bacterium]|nr:YjgN family protein [Bacteroidales bacterium]MDD3989480.1 DUF898 family protein [Bacteroidales bacterium]MDD4638364.1 DUF898 family protein [Bacteroidales bacterium]
MKNYFDFTLSGKKFLPVWLVIYLLIFLPYIFVLRYSVQMMTPQMMTPGMQTLPELPDNMILFGLIMICIGLAALVIGFFICKILIESVKYSDANLKFNGRFWSFVGKILLGILLSAVTLGIYAPWFARDIHRFFVNGTSLNDSGFEFKGKGGTLFLIFLLGMFLPVIVVSLLFASQLAVLDGFSIYTVLFQVLMVIVMIPGIYLIYKWMIDIKYKDYQIKWQTALVNSSCKILFELFLALITLGIYLPLTYLKLYKYFVERTVAVKEGSTLSFGYELNIPKDFFYVWGQVLLIIITAGIYYPWAAAKIGRRVLSKTYLTQSQTEPQTV